MLVKIVLLLFVLFAVARLVKRFRQREVNGRELGVWMILWLAVTGAVIWPQKTDALAQFAGVGRGADLLVYISILALFYVAFKLLVADKKKQGEITELTRQLALKEAQKGESRNNNQDKLL